MQPRFEHGNMHSETIRSHIADHMPIICSTEVLFEGDYLFLSVGYGRVSCGGDFPPQERQCAAKGHGSSGSGHSLLGDS